VQVENNDAEMDFDHLEADKAFLSTDLTVTDQDRDCARKIFDGDESFVSKAGAASWLGQTMAKNARTRTAYMELFDWRGVNILQAFRDLCERLVVRAESQQLDRVIDAFSERWCECNQNHGFRDRGETYPKLI
jgi:Sec7-like guanine-nucleotide exchange factor